MQQASDKGDDEESIVKISRHDTFANADGPRNATARCINVCIILVPCFLRYVLHGEETATS